MGDNLTRTDKAGCCGCLTGLIIGVILLVTVGVKNQSPEYFLYSGCFLESFRTQSSAMTKRFDLVLDVFVIQYLSLLVS